MKGNFERITVFLDELEENLSILVSGFYGLVIMEGDIKSLFKITSDLEQKKEILAEAQKVVEGTHDMIEESTRVNNEIINDLKKFPEEGRKHAIQEHIRLRQRILIDMEAYLISLESQLNELKNEI